MSGTRRSMPGWPPSPGKGEGENATSGGAGGAPKASSGAHRDTSATTASSTTPGEGDFRVPEGWDDLRHRVEEGVAQAKERARVRVSQWFPERQSRPLWHW